MSKISTIHDALVTAVSGVLTSRIQLPNPYIPEANNELFLSNGFGVAVGPGARTDRQISCQMSWQRDFTIILTNQMTTTDHNTDEREDITKSLLEDHFTLFDLLEKTTVSGTIKTEIFSDSGITFLEPEGEGLRRYLLMEIDVAAEYLEDLT